MFCKTKCKLVLSLVRAFLSMKNPLNLLGSQGGTCIGRQVGLFVKLDLNFELKEVELCSFEFVKTLYLLILA